MVILLETAKVNTMDKMKEEYIKKAIEWAESKGYYDIHVDAEGYDDPKSFHNKTSDRNVSADLTFLSPRGGKHYCCIAMKQEDTESLVTKWKFLSTIASMKNGKLHLLAPRGHKSFTQNILDTYNFTAELYSI